MVQGWSRPGCIALLLVGLVPTEGSAQIGFDGIPFIRGDTNGDRKVDISDGVATLTTLFLGGPDLECADAADANDSGTVDIADAIFSFDYLFLGGPAPPTPGPFRCGCDTTMDGLLCTRSSCTPEKDTWHLSDFSQFEYRIEPLCGLFFAEDGRLVEAFILRAPDGSHSFMSTVLQAAEEGCLPEYCNDCFITRDLPERVLTQEEVDQVLQQFSTVEVRLSGDPVCSCFPLDPEGIRVLQWDTLLLTDDVCQDMHLSTFDAAEIEWLLQGFSAD